MNNFRRYLGFAAILTLFGAMGAGAADLLVDDFSDATASHIKGWTNLNEGTMDIAVGGGSCAIDNSRNGYSGEYLYPFGANKPSVFTLSFVIKSMDKPGAAGAFFCRQETPLSGYLMTIKDEYVIVYKMVGGSGQSVFYEKSFDLKGADNKLAVSKSGSTFNLFVNDALAGQFTDAQYASGDLSFFIDDGAKAVFGEVRVTDAFTEGGKRREFSDNFDDPSLRYWKPLNAGGPVPEVGVVSGKLRMKTATGGAAWRYIDIDLTEFEAKVEVSHLSGSSEAPYGIILLGADVTTQAASFAILGKRYYGGWTATNSSYTPALNTKILGAGPAGTTFTDTIEIKKKAGSSAYEFYANGELLMASTDLVNFKITGIGLFANGDVEVAFDNFHVKETSATTSIRHDNGKRISRKPVVSAKNAPQAFYDLRGRKRYTLTAAQSSNRAAIRRAAGVYVNENGREIHIRGKR